MAPNVDSMSLHRDNTGANLTGASNRAGCVVSLENAEALAERLIAGTPWRGDLVAEAVALGAIRARDEQHAAYLAAVTAERDRLAAELAAAQEGAASLYAEHLAAYNTVATELATARAQVADLTELCEALFSFGGIDMKGDDGERRGRRG